MTLESEQNLKRGQFAVCNGNGNNFVCILCSLFDSQCLIREDEGSHTPKACLAGSQSNS